MKTLNRILCGALFASAVLAIPATASAQMASSTSSEPIGIWVSPFVGVLTGNDSTDKSATTGISAGYLVYKGWLGIEGEVAMAPNFFIDNKFSTQRSLTTAMGNIVVVSPYWKSEMFQIQVSGGLGMIRPHIEEAGGFSTAEVKKLGYNVGGGVTGFINRNVGVRADIRYLRTLKKDKEINTLGRDFSEFGFWRSSIGLVVRF